MGEYFFRITSPSRSTNISKGSPSRIRKVRRISLGMTTRPKSSIRRTIPVAFKLAGPPSSRGFRFFGCLPRPETLCPLQRAWHFLALVVYNAALPIIHQRRLASCWCYMPRQIHLVENFLYESQQLRICEPSRTQLYVVCPGGKHH